MNNQPFSFGAIERIPDTRDYPLGAFTPETFPESYFTDISKYPVENQNKIPACGSHAGSFIKNVQDDTRLSPAFLWKLIKRIDGFPLEAGTDMLSILKTLQKNGTCKFDPTIDDTTLDLATYSDANLITLDQSVEAMKHRISTYAFQFNPTFDQIKAAIYKHKVVLVLIRVGKEFWTPSWSETQPLRPPQTIVAGHFMVLYGYDKDFIYFRNEWGNTYGETGNGRFGIDYLPFVDEIGTAVDTTDDVFTRNLSYGSYGIDVWKLQNYLVKNGFGNFFPTSFFGFKTESAVKLFQLKYGIQQTGTAGPITRGKLNLLLSAASM